MLLHKQVEATATPTIEKGTAVLLVAAYTRDRGGDVIQRGAFKSTTAAWIDSGKQIPLAWDHKSDKPEQLIGTVDPHSMRETRDGLIAEARLDLEGSATAREAWRLVKSDSIGVSFGYLAESKAGKDGTRLLTSIDLYEISLTATPMHGSTRVVSWKSAETGTSTSSTDAADAEFELHRRATAKADAAYERQRMDREVEELAAELKAKRAREAKAARPVVIKNFEIG